MDPLTRRQQQVLDYVQRTQEQTGIPPTVREICAHFGFRSPNAAANHLRALKAKGALRGAPGKARSIQVSTPLRQLRNRVVDIPLFGAIPAGFAEDRRQEPDGCVSVDVATLGLRPTARTFALEVSGDSMIGRHICPGDLVVCEHGLEPRHGDVVAALIDNESTLKTFVRQGRKPCLKAENPNYPKLIPAAELVIQGVVVAVIRRLRDSAVTGR